MPSATVDPPLRFGRFEISPATRALLVDGEPAALGARAFDLLLALAQRRERVVTREELLQLVWPGVVVEEHNITAQISSLRKLLGPQAIATVPGRGYRFTAMPNEPPGDAPAEVAPAGPPHNLPEQRTRFIGRDDALAELARLLPRTRLLTLTGIGGSGKTRLALELARQELQAFGDGVWFVDLAPLRQAERVGAACAAALSLATDGDVASPDRLAAQLAGREALIVLDNCEHVRDGAAALVNALLARPGRARVLATSREPLAVPGEQLYPVRGLSLPATPALDDVRSADSARVFVDRARLALPEFAVHEDNAAALVEICRRLDGIALAIELAAACTRVLPVSEIALRLEDRFRLLTQGHATVARQQTLLATMQWSHDLLTRAEQRMLRQLAVFAGGCTLEAAAAVAQTRDEYEALALLTALYDKSLLVVERSARPRYRMLETVRQYAQQRLDESGEAATARARHATHFLALGDAAAPHLRGPQQSAWMARLREEHENLAAAAAWCMSQHGDAERRRGLRLMAATTRYWLFNEVELGCRLSLDALQGACVDEDLPDRCQVLLGLAAMHMHRGQGEAGLAQAREALALAERLGAVEWQAMALNVIGACLKAGSDEAAALRYYERSRDLALAGGCAAPLASALNNIATIEFCRGRLDDAARVLRQALHVARGRGDARGALISLHNLVRVLVAARRHDEARACCREGELLLRGIGEDVLKLELLEVSGGLMSSQGEHARAARWWGAAVQRFDDAGYRRPPEDETQLARLMAASREALGDAVFDAELADGGRLEVDGAMQELRRWLEGA
jgi:predicted ATPase/DNA-binding winged helix-turn-helix (wHTH) protein